MSKKYEEITNLFKGSVNKIVYLVTVKEFGEYIFYVTSSLERKVEGIDFKGYYVSAGRVNNIKTYSEAVHAVNMDKSELIDILYPWHMVRNIRNITYRAKK
jgi:hypothetical protein